MKHNKWFVALMLLFIPIIAAAQLPQGQQVATKVPFAFMVGKVAVPAGEVTVQLANETGSILLVRNRDAKVGLYTLTAGTRSEKPAPVPAMIFHKYGETYFLAGLRIADSRSVYAFNESKLEKELRAENVPQAEVQVASAK